MPQLADNGQRPRGLEVRCGGASRTSQANALAVGAVPAQESTGARIPLSHSVHRHLRIEIQSYDEMIRRLIPGYEEMVAVAAREATRTSPHRVVDLGAGTGALSEAILQANRSSHVQLIDIDREMLFQARDRLSGCGARVQFTEMSFLEPLPPCGAAVASIALHHVRSITAKRTLYRRIHAAVEPGGAFVNADAAMAADPAKTEAIWRSWIDHMGAHGIDEDGARRHFAQWAEEDTYFTLEEELEAVDDAGFETSCVWRHGPMCVVVGRKPS